MHLVIDITFHGYGHISQIAPVVDTLARKSPGLHLTVRSPAPEAVLRSRIHSPFDHVRLASDVGIPMINALEVDRPLTESSYRDFHRNLGERISDYSRWLVSIGADSVLSNVAYVPLAAARRRGLPSAALSSLNWADMFRGVVSPQPDLVAIYEEIVQSYRAADLFLLTEPGMAPQFPIPLERVPPVSGSEPARREELRALEGALPGEKLVLVSLGGIPTPLDLRRWPKRDGWIWLVPEADLPQGRGDMRATERPGWSFVSILRSCDAVVTKPGYGLYAEAACAGVPVLSSDRPEWPEARHLIDWMRSNAGIRIIPRERLLAGDFGDELHHLLAGSPRPAVAALGAARAADLLIDLFQRRER